MKIAMVSEHASPLAVIGGVDAGGQNVHVAALAGALAELGHEVIVYTRRDSPDLPRRVAMDSGVSVEHVDAGPARSLPKDDLFPHMVQFSKRLLESWMAERPDVVHSHFWMSASAALGAAPRLGIPVVHTFHALGTVKRRYQGHKDTSPAERIATEASIVRRVDRIVATCSDEVTELVRMGADPDRMSVVPCGVDTDVFTPAGPAWSRTPGCHRVVAVGRLVERKGIDDVIRAVAQLPDCELVVAGGADIDQLAGDTDAVRLLERARRANVAERVHLVGRLDREAVPCLLRSADLAVCVPWYEPFGIVPVEAMSCGVPVVASDVGGLSDTVVDGVTGVHVPPRQPRRLARAVRDLLADPPRRTAMGHAGRVRAVERYQWKQVALDTISAYQAAGAVTHPRRMALGLP